MTEEPLMAALDYDTVAGICMTGSLLLYIVLFLLVLVYAFFLLSEQSIDNVQCRSLDLGDDCKRTGGPG
jgi:hypothetical protein